MTITSDLDRDLRDAREGVHPVQIEIWRRMTPDQKAQRVSDMAGAAKQMAFAIERTQNPDLHPREIHRRALGRYLRFSEWEPEKLAAFQAFLDRWLLEKYPDEASPDGNL